MGCNPGRAAARKLTSALAGRVSEHVFAYWLPGRGEAHCISIKSNYLSGKGGAGREPVRGPEKGSQWVLYSCPFLQLFFFFLLCFFSFAAANVVALFGGYAQTVTDSFFFVLLA